MTFTSPRTLTCGITAFLDKVVSKVSTNISQPTSLAGQTACLAYSSSFFTPSVYATYIDYIAEMSSSPSSILYCLPRNSPTPLERRARLHFFSTTMSLLEFCALSHQLLVGSRLLKPAWKASIGPVWVGWEERPRRLRK